MIIRQDHYSNKYLAHIGMPELAVNMARHNANGLGVALS